MIRTRMMGRSGPFPATPRSTWSAADLVRWQTARSVADAHPGNARGGWTDETAGHFPGTYRMLTCWAASPVAGLAAMHVAEPVIGQPWAVYLAGAVGAGMIGLGALIHMLAWGGYRPSILPVSAVTSRGDTESVGSGSLR